MKTRDSMPGIRSSFVQRRVAVAVVVREYRAG